MASGAIDFILNRIETSISVVEVVGVFALLPSHMWISAGDAIDTMASVGETTVDLFLDRGGFTRQPRESQISSCYRRDGGGWKVISVDGRILLGIGRPRCKFEWCVLASGAIDFVLNRIETSISVVIDSPLWAFFRVCLFLYAPLYHNFHILWGIPPRRCAKHPGLQ